MTATAPRDCLVSKERNMEDPNCVDTAPSVGSWLVGHEMTTILKDVASFLATWFFSISDCGVMYIRPQSKTLTLEDVDDLLRRIQVISDDGFPSVMVFDFTRLTASSRDWYRVEEKLRTFALRVKARIAGDIGRDLTPHCALISQSSPPAREVNGLATHEQWRSDRPSVVVLFRS